ncbi:Chromo domain/shadow [Penicillium sp. DV-2018c]|nr:Chromo domain/shadow [Penicillium sp. DV-2018c]
MTPDPGIKDVSDQHEDNDVDSLASTAESEPAAEYVVDDIHAERRFYLEPQSENDEGVFITQYLVEWAGYSRDRCSWEPKESFTSEETLRGWEEKKKQIAEGKIKRFPLKSWERRMAMLEKKKQKRKADRRRKREQRARLGKTARPESSRRANSHIVDDRGEHETSPGTLKASRRLSGDSNASSALFVSTQTQPPPDSPVRRPSPQQIVPSRPATSTLQGNTDNVSDSRLTRLTKDIKAKQKAPAQNTGLAKKEKPTLSLFGTGPKPKSTHREGKWGERAPDISQIQMMRPSDFSARTNMGTGTSGFGPSPISLESPEALNRPVTGDPVGLTSIPTLRADETNTVSAQKPEKPTGPPCLFVSRCRPSTATPFEIGSRSVVYVAGTVEYEAAGWSW